MTRRAIATAVLSLTLVGAALSAPRQTDNPGTVQPDPRFRVTTETVPNGPTLLTVQNTSKIFITGLLAIGNEGRVSDLRVFDSVLNGLHDRAIAPYQSHTLVMFGPNRAPGQVTPQVSLKAVIFSDGSTWGDGVYIQRLLRLRRLAYVYTKEAVGMIQSARKEGLSCSQLADEADKAAKSKMQAARDVDEKQIVEHAFGNISVPLRTSGRICGTGAIPQIVYTAVSSRLFNEEGALEHSKPSVVPTGPGGIAAH